MKEFLNHLYSVEYPKNKTSWNVSGILKNKSNQHLKFDTTSMINLSKGLIGKSFSSRSKADKIVIEEQNSFIVVDTKELITYLKKNKIKKIHLDIIKKHLYWNIILNKK